METNKPEPIFPRIDMKKQNKEKEKKVEEVKPQVPEEKPEEKKEEYISIDDFAKVDLRVATIVEVERLEGTDKIYKMKVDDGERIRTVCAGMVPYYEADYMVGKQIIIVANLKPRKMKGVLSEGMMLAGGEEVVKFLSPEAPLPNGSKIR